ncbi:MAG: hypothetical protein MJ097_04880 [Dorea sp.]|nr:hypothetical protein [Dorea sp.]
MKYKRLFLKLSEEEIQEAIQRFHFEDHHELIYSLIPGLDHWIKPEFYYFYEKSCSDCVNVVVTLGDLVDKRNQEFQQQEHFLEAHALDCLSLALLSQSYEKIKEIIYREKRQFLTNMYFPEESRVPELIRSFQEKDPDFPVRLNPAGALIPSKTVVFQGKLSIYHQELSTGCQHCSNRTCVFRKEN